MAAKKKTTDDEVALTIESFLKQQRGAGKALFTFGNSPVVKVDVVPTGSLSLDVALGVGGLPRGRIVEIYGPESAGKTSVVLSAIAQAQKAGLGAAFIDAEHALAPAHAKMYGVNMDELAFYQPDCGEDGLDMAFRMCEAGVFAIVAVDSVAALVPLKELQGEMGDQMIGLQARMMAQAMRKLTKAAYDSNTCLVFINQLREKIGVTHGNPEVTPGGRALKFTASVRLSVRAPAGQRDLRGSGKVFVGQEANVTVSKNKVAPPFSKAIVYLSSSEGMDFAFGLNEAASTLDVFMKSGGSHYWPEDVNKNNKLASSKADMLEKMKSDPDLAAEIERRVRGLLAATMDGSTFTASGPYEGADFVEKALAEPDDDFAEEFGDAA
jgi:recombination protein RecA